MSKTITIALAGNPNSGKTTLFNNITGARQHVGNYPGVTVEKKEGRCTHGGAQIRIVDLPGTYGLTAYSVEELVARNFIVDEKPDVVVDVIDASNLERNLYLAVQMMELGAALVLAFNMSDVAEARGIKFDLELLSELLGAPIVPTVAHKRGGTEELLDAAVRVATDPSARRRPAVRYGPEIEKQIARIAGLLAKEQPRLGRYDPRWLAIKLLENDRDVREKVGEGEARALSRKAAADLTDLLGDSPEIIIADRRYGFISGACQEAVRWTVETRHTVSDKIDSVATSRMLGLPIFLVLMYLVFHLTFTLGRPPMGRLEQLFGWLGGTVSGLWPEGSDSILRSLLVDGIIAGVGGVIVFLPNIILLFLAIAFLEDTGYMARAAFLMDHLMHKIGLHGKSFIPMVIGFGCSVPAIMATRTLESRRDRLTTMLVLPLMSCGARLPIYALLIPAFFSDKVLLNLGIVSIRRQAFILLSIYLIGIVLAIALAKLLRSTLLKGETHAFVMELPPYRPPTLKGMLIHTWQRAWMYLKKAGTIILAIAVVMWALATFPQMPDAGNATRAEKLSYSAAGRIGKVIEPALEPLGFDWRVSTALIGAFAAKEVFVAQMGIVYSVEGADEEKGTELLRKRLQKNYTPLQAFCIMLFCLITAPCVATIAVTRKESGSWGWAMLQLGGLTALAYVVTLAVYQVGRLFA